VIVLDASAALEFLLGTVAGGRVAARLGSETLHAPQLLDLEVAQVLRRLAGGAEVSAARAEQALGDLRRLRLFRYGHDGLLPRVWQLRERMTAYDAAYVALAEALPAILVTRDGRLARSGGHGAVIELVEA
jgi:predicted nucleic acid-binding protein